MSVASTLLLLASSPLLSLRPSLTSTVHSVPLQLPAGCQCPHLPPHPGPITMTIPHAANTTRCVSHFVFATKCMWLPSPHVPCCLCSSWSRYPITSLPFCLHPHLPCILIDQVSTWSPKKTCWISGQRGQGWFGDGVFLAVHSQKTRG